MRASILFAQGHTFGLPTDQRVILTTIPTTELKATGCRATIFGPQRALDGLNATIAPRRGCRHMHKSSTSKHAKNASNGRIHVASGSIPAPTIERVTTKRMTDLMIVRAAKLARGACVSLCCRQTNVSTMGSMAILMKGAVFHAVHSLAGG